MPGFELVEKLPGRSDPSLSGVVQSLSNTFLGVGAGGNVEQALIRFCVLHDRRGPPVKSKHYRALAPPELFQKYARAPAKGGQRLDILRDVKRRPRFIGAPF
jgi:hypothetical protein